jgi:VanZ family protein
MISNQHHRLLPWFVCFLYMVGIFILSAQSTLPFLERIERIGRLDFVLHVVEYAFFGLLLSWALVSSGATRTFVLWAFLIGLIYGITDEIHQYFVPARDSSLLDVTADGIGSILGSCLFHVVRNLKQVL